MKTVLKIIAALILIALTLNSFACADTSDNENQDYISATEENNEMTDETTIELTTTESSLETDTPASPWDELREKAENGVIKVLFVGDSLTYYNDMPLIFQSLSNAAGKKVKADSITKGGTGIAMMKDDSALWQKVADKIASENWDVVVFQPERNRPAMSEFFPHYLWKEYMAACDMVSLIKDAGALPLLYSTFGVTKGSVTRDGFTKAMTRKEHTDLVTAYNAGVSELIGCKTVYAGATFNAAYEENPSINLYHTDKSHPNLAGSYLVAADFYTVIFGESAKDISHNASLDDSLAATLRKTSELLLTYVPTERTEIKEAAEPEKLSLEFGPHGFSSVSASGVSNALNIVSESEVKYTYQSGHGILESYAKRNGECIIGNSMTVEVKISFGKYCGKLNPSGGFMLKTESGKVIRMYARTNASNITGNDCSSAKYEIRVDVDKKNSVTLGSYDSEIVMKVVVSPEKLCLYVNEELFVTMTSTGSEFYNGTRSADLVYRGENLHFGLVFCYADITFTDLKIN